MNAPAARLSQFQADLARLRALGLDALARKLLADHEDRERLADLED